ncbi:MAG: DUF2911 domain-containing protein [Gemmatimonadaceae bacterium]
MLCSFHRTESDRRARVAVRVSGTWLRGTLAGAPRVALFVLLAPAAVAQSIRPSQPALVAQDIGRAHVEIAYHRPVARNRLLFGALVPWNRPWSPSADTAARFSTTALIQINGAPLPPGTYSLFAIPDSLSWTFVFSSKYPAHHLAFRDRVEVLRVTSIPRHEAYMETLGFYFPTVDADSADLVLHWGTTVVSMHITAR